MTDGFRVPRGNGCPSFAVSEAQATFSFFGHSFSFTRERERIAPPEAPKCESEDYGGWHPVTRIKNEEWRMKNCGRAFMLRPSAPLRPQRKTQEDKTSDDGILLLSQTKVKVKNPLDLPENAF